MATPPQNNNNGSDNFNPPGHAPPGPGPPGITREELLIDWINKRIQLASAIRAQQPHVPNLHGHGGGIFPQGPAVVPPTALQGAPVMGASTQGALASTTAEIRDSLDQIQTYFRNQQIAAINAAQTNTTLPANLQQQPLDILRHSLAVQAQARQIQGQSTTMNYPALAGATGAQALAQTVQPVQQQEQTPEIIREPNEEPPQAPRLSSRNTLQETMRLSLREKITQKIQEKLKELKPEITETEQAIAIEHLLRKEEPQNPQQNMQASSAGEQQPGKVEMQQKTPSLHNVDASSLACQGGEAQNGTVIAQEAVPNPLHQSRPADVADMEYQNNNRKTKSVAGKDGQKDVAVAKQIVEANKVDRKRKPTEGRDNTASSKRGKVDETSLMEAPGAKAAATTVRNTPGKGSTAVDTIDLCDESDESPGVNPPEEKMGKDISSGQRAKEISSKLDKIVDSFPDENVRSAVVEDRENLRAKRRELQQLYENQIEQMESRLRVYARLEGLAKQIARDRAESKAKNSRTKNSRSEVASDMIHLSLKNYRMLEDTSDRLLGIDKEKE